MKYIYLAIILLTFSCKQKYFYSSFKSVDATNWQAKDSVEYIFKIDDITKKYDINICIRHQKDYEFSNFWLNIKTDFTTPNFTKLEIPLFNNEGKPYGKTSGNSCTQTISFQKNITFAKKGNYKIIITHLMRKNPINGITDIGVLIDKKP